MGTQGSLASSLAARTAESLRQRFPSAIPAATGRRIDVKVWDDTLGLELLVSIEASTDAGPGDIRRYGQGLKDRADVIHRRQPYAVMVAIFLLPLSACGDGYEFVRGESGVSSFANVVRRLRIRQGRAIGAEERSFGRFDLVEKLYLGLYGDAGPNEHESLCLFDVAETAPLADRPDALRTLDELADEIVELVGRRNTRHLDLAVGRRRSFH